MYHLPSTPNDYHPQTIAEVTIPRRSRRLQTLLVTSLGRMRPPRCCKWLETSRLVVIKAPLKKLLKGQTKRAEKERRDEEKWKWRIR